MAYIGPFPVKVEQGGTGETSITANAVVIGDTADQLTSTNVGTNGQVLLGAALAAPAFASLTSTGGTITFTTGTNSLNLEATSPSFNFVDVTGTTQAMVSNTIYLADNAGLVTLTLPTSATQGTTIRVVGNGAGGWTVAQNSGQSINIGSDSTTVGVGGSLSSTQRYDAIEILCSVANTRWNVMSSQGNITVV